MAELKITALDIETHPAKVYVYDLFRPFISHKQIIEPSRISCFSYQVYGEKKVHFVSEYHDGRDGLMNELWRVLDEADVVMGYNSAGFDYPWIVGELMVEGFSKPSPVKHIDLYQTMKRNNRFLSRKLDYVSERLLGDKKIDVNTMTLAIECASEDPDVAAKAWAKMKRYSIKDTKLLFPLFEAVKSYVKMPHPLTEGDDACHSCGSEDLQKRGFHVTRNARYQRFRCNPCGSWFHGTTRVPVSNIRAI